MERSFFEKEASENITEWILKNKDRLKSVYF
jgi:hypothetical protein